MVSTLQLKYKSSTPTIETLSKQLLSVNVTSLSSWDTCFLRCSFSFMRAVFLRAASFSLASSVCTYYGDGGRAEKG